VDGAHHLLQAVGVQLHVVHNLTQLIGCVDMM
jgi:hypothetical protein